MNQILKLTIFFTLYCVVHGQCNGLTVYDNGIKINTSTVCIKQFKNAETIAFYESFNQSLLPPEFPRSDTEVQGPYRMHVRGIETPVVENSVDYTYPGLSIEWEPPLTSTARQNCYGYLVAWFTEDGKLKMCQLFHINKMSQNTLLFQYNLSTVNQNSSFTVRVYSMPALGLEFKENEQTFVSTRIVTPIAYKTGNPFYWAPFLAYDILNNGTVKVTFSLPPPEFNITEFNVYLIEDTKEVDTVNVPLALRTEQKTEFSLSLTARHSGYYYAVVWAKDKFPLKDGLCQCWAWQNNQKTCKATCGGTKTNNFYVNITNPPTVVPALPTTVASTIPTSPTNPTFPPEDIPNNLAVILGVIFAALLLLALIICVCLFRNKSKVKGWIRRFLPPCQPPEFSIQDPRYAALRILPPSAAALPKHGPERDPYPFDGSAPTLSRKTIYLVSADDHEAHVALVEALASFLEIHCYCNVILPSRNDPYETRTYEWFISNINKSDFIMFVDSKGAQKMTDAHLKNKSYTNRTVGPDGDLFNFSLKHILRNAEVREKSLILVSFSGYHCKTYFGVSFVYFLPQHLRQLLKKIHRLDSSAISSYSKILPLDLKNIEELTEGAKMLAAKNYVKLYEENNPHCFENNFGDLKDLKLQCDMDMKPQCNRYNSIDSGCPEDRLDSISQQVSFSGSPTAIPEQIGYPKLQVHSSNKADFKDTFSDDNGSVYTNGLSCYTIKEIHEGRDELKQESSLDKFSIVPPESASQIAFDSYSTAMSAVNKNNDEDDEGMDIDGDSSIQQWIIPPENPLDIQLDTVSCALADINANADKLLLQGDTKFLFEDETIGSLSQFDSVSV